MQLLGIIPSQLKLAAHAALAFGAAPQLVQGMHACTHADACVPACLHAWVQARLFSRNCEDRTAAFPDVCARVRAAAGAASSSLVLDAEVVAVEPLPPGEP